MITKDKLTKKMRWELADYLAAERLPEINKNVKEVHTKDTLYTRYIKRIIDVVISFIACVICLPINFVVGIITIFDVGFPIFFRQQRAGKNGKIFEIIKFRNMKDTKDENGELLPTTERVTKFGKFVRRTSIDELLNFWSILKGDMSIIGPRPLVPEYTARYNKRHHHRMDVRPGLECPSRTHNERIRTLEEQFENDIWYVEHVSFRTDCMMIINIVRFMFDKKSTAARATATTGTFMGYDKEGKAISLKDIPDDYIDNYFQKYGEM